MGPNQKLNKHVNSVLRASNNSNSKEGTDKPMGNVPTGGPMPAMSLDMLEHEED